MDGIFPDKHLSNLSKIRWINMNIQIIFLIASRQAEGEWEATGDSGQEDGQAGAEQERVWSSEARKRPTAGEAGAEQPRKLPAAGYTALQQGGAAQVHTHTHYHSPSCNLKLHKANNYHPKESLLLPLFHTTCTTQKHDRLLHEQMLAYIL